jgi:hypothetical protein
VTVPAIPARERELISLLIVDDHPVVRDGLRGMFGADPRFEVVGVAGDGAPPATCGSPLPHRDRGFHTKLTRSSHAGLAQVWSDGGGNEGRMMEP